MAATALDVPHPVRTEPILVRRPQVGPLWRRLLVRAALVPLVVLAPLVALAPTADHRFNIYWHGGLYRENPLRIAPDTIASLPGYLRTGNFRPLGRMLEKALDLLAYLLSEVGVPANLGLRVVEFGAVVLLSFAAVLLVECVLARGAVFRQPPSTVAVVVPFAVGTGFVAAGRASPVVLFGGLYFASAALVLGVAALTCRISVERRISRWWAPLLIVGGAALAAFNELVYFAVPLATVAVAARGRLVLDRPWAELARSGAARALALMWLGFLPVFVASRVVIARYCATGPCYRGSAVAAGPAVAETLPVRLAAWFPPLMWRSAVQGDSHAGWGVALLAFAILAVLAVSAVRDLPQLSAVDRRSAAALTAVAAVLLGLGATVGALSADAQQIVAAHRWGQGWRDTALTAPAGALLMAGAVHLFGRPRAVRLGGPRAVRLFGRRRALLAALIAVLACAGAVSAAANKRFRDNVMATSAARLDDRLAQAMADFDPTPAGAAARCAMRDEFFARFRDSPFSLRRFDQAFDTAARQRGGQPFCPVGR